MIRGFTLMLVMGVSSLKYSHDVYSSFIVLLFFTVFICSLINCAGYALLLTCVLPEAVTCESRE